MGLLPLDFETQMLIGAAPMEAAVPAAINFLLSEVQENACKKVIHEYCGVAGSRYHRFYVSPIYIAILVTQ